jgi:hypothetical protein
MLSRTGKHPCLIIATLATLLVNYAAFDFKTKTEYKASLLQNPDRDNSEQYFLTPIQMTHSIIYY